MIADINDIEKLLTSNENFYNLRICETEKINYIIFTYKYLEENFLYVRSISKSNMNSITTLEIDIDDDKLFTDEYSCNIFVNPTGNTEIYEDNPLYDNYMYSESDNYFYCTFITDEKEVKTLMFNKNNFYEDEIIYRKKYICDQNIFMTDFNFDNTDADSFEICRMLEIKFYEVDGSVYTDFYWVSDGDVYFELSQKVEILNINRHSNVILENGYTVDPNFGYNASIVSSNLLSLDSGSELVVDGINYQIINYQIINYGSSYIYDLTLRDINSDIEILRGSSIKIIKYVDYTDETVNGNINIMVMDPKMIYKDDLGVFDRNNLDYDLISNSMSKNKSLLINYKTTASEINPDVFNVVCFNKYSMYTTDNDIFDENGLKSFVFKINSFVDSLEDENGDIISTQNLYIDTYWIDEGQLMTIGYIDSGSESYSIGECKFGMSIYKDSGDGTSIIDTFVNSEMYVGETIDTDLTINDFSAFIGYKDETLFVIDNTNNTEFQFHNVFESINFITKTESFSTINVDSIEIEKTYFIVENNLQEYKLIKYITVPDEYLTKEMILVKMLPLLPDYLQNNEKNQKIMNVFEKLQNANIETSNAFYDEFDSPILLGAYINNNDDPFMVDLLEINPTLYFYDGRNSYGLNAMLSTIDKFKENNDILNIDDKYLIDLIKNNGLDYLYDTDYFSGLMNLPFYEDSNDDYLNLHISTDISRDVFYNSTEINEYKNRLKYDIPEIQDEIRNIFNIMAKYTRYNSSKFFLDLIVGLFSFNYSLILSINTDNRLIDIDNLTFLGTVVDNRLYFNYDNNILIKNMSGLSRSIKYIEKIIKNFIPVNFVYEGLLLNVKKEVNNYVYEVSTCSEVIINTSTVIEEDNGIFTVLGIGETFPVGEENDGYVITADNSNDELYKYISDEWVKLLTPLNYNILNLDNDNIYEFVDDGYKIFKEIHNVMGIVYSLPENPNEDEKYVLRNDEMNDRLYIQSGGEWYSVYIALGDDMLNLSDELIYELTDNGNYNIFIEKK